jgi:PAS domain S-box-containing protein
MDLVHEDDRKNFSEAVGHAIATGGEFAMSYRIVRPDGSVRDLDWQGAVERGGNGFPRRLDGAVCDVTDHRRAEPWLVASESRYRLIVENVNDGIWVLDAEGRTDFVNRRVCQILGLPAEELLGRAPAEFTDAKGAAALAEVWRRDEQRGYLELALTHADGSPVWVALSTSRYQAPWGQAELHVLTDLTQRREMEARLRHAAERETDAALSRPEGEPALTVRELEVLRLAAEGHTDRVIADQLVVSVHTVKTHLEHVYAKLGVGSRTAAVARALRTELIR